jgi:hypothetical protein
MGKTVLICGGRDYSDWDFMKEVLESAKREGFDQIIHGGASGADAMAREIGFSLGFRILCYRAEWAKYGRSAGPIRNQTMLEEGKPDLVIAFPGGRGTADMVSRANYAGVRVIELADGPETVEVGRPPAVKPKCRLEASSVMTSLPPQYGWYCKLCQRGTSTFDLAKPECLSKGSSG